MIQLPAILAQVDYTTRFTGLKGAFGRQAVENSTPFEIPLFVHILLALIVTLLIAKRVYHRKTRTTQSTRPVQVFSHALKQLGVGMTDRILLRMAARNSRLDQPAIMLFSPELFERHVGRWAASIVFRPAKEHAMKRIEVIARKAFG